MAASSSRGATRGGGGGGGGNPRSGWNQANGGQGRRDKRPNHDSHGNHGSRANHGSHGSGHHAGGGRGHGGISEKDKETIVRASRTKTVQVAGDCTDDIIVAVGGDEKLQHIASFFIKKKGFTGFDGQRQIRHFINSCLVNLSNHHSVDTTGLLRDLSSSPGLDRLTEIMSMPMSIDAGDTKNLLSFQHVALPLVGIFTRESICQTTMTSESGLIYATVYLNWRQFLEQGVIRCMGELLDRGSLEDRHPAARMLSKDPSVCHISSLQCAMLGIVRLVYQLIKRQQDAKIALAPLVESLHQQTLRCIGQSTTSAEIKFMNDILKEDVHRLRKIVGDTQDTLHEPMGPSKPLDSGSLKASKTSKGPNMVHLAMAYDPPGDLSKYGPRHDNDHVEISRIDLLPTNMEITCPRPPFLPSNDIADAPHFLPPGWRRQLDTHFRLYREDLLDPLRQGIMAFLDVLGKTDKKNENDLLKRNQLRKRLDNNISLNVYGSVKFLGMNCTQKQGGSIQISFAQPPQAMKAAKKARIEFWERSKSRLMQGSLICITSKATETSCADATSGYPNIITVLGTVVSRDVETLAADDAVARIQISLTDPTPYLLMLNAETNTGKSQNQWFLVEFTSGLFATYRPILRALQSCVPATLPFGKYLAPSIEELAEIRKVGRTIDPPLYSRAPGFAFDLSVILKGRGFRLDVSNKDSVIQAVNMLQRHSTLDDTQASSLVDTLCREVALISGPPGTGKTKIGVDLMRVLLHNSSAMNCGPIVCICYTNHALDQFLEHLLDENITDIVRVGTRSKSIRLENCNLESLMRIQGKPFSVRQALRDVDKEWAKVTGEIVQLEKALRNSILDWKYVGPTIMMNSPEQWEQLESLRRDRTRPEKVDGDFTKVQRKAEQEPYVRWATCEDIAEMERWNTKQKHETKKGKKAPTPTLNGFKALAGDTAVPKEQQQRPSLYTIPKKDRPLEALNGDLWSMSRKERQRLLDSWKSEVQESMMELMGTLLKQIEKIGKKKDDAFDDVRRGILRKAKVIGLTTNGAAKNQTLIEAVAPKIIICEEAGEVLESHILATLSASTQHLILIGDHKQLRPSIETHNLSSDSSIGQHYNLDKSLFERLVTAKIPLPSSELTIQRRMRPEISSLIRNTLYKNLKDGERVHQYPPVSGMRKNLFFMNHGHPEDTKDQYGMQSFSNTFEVNMVEALAHYLIKNGYDKPGDIAILTPYLGQLSKLRDCLRNSFALVIDERDQEQLDQSELDNEEMNEQMDKKGTDSATHARTKNVALQRHLTLRTIDNYQGEEAKIVIITLVRSNVRQKGSASSGSIGFLKSPNRTNVLLSRAQHGMYIVGNAGLMDSAKNGIWPTVIDELRREGRIGEGFPIYCKNHPEIATFTTKTMSI
ncbi:hypothetical protein BGZ51_003012 [Haplosporangium sp. Z 767]|nr:hypothetical protein BGZ51_003012 [Haplosporangium sp. Z 767]